MLPIVLLQKSPFHSRTKCMQIKLQLQIRIYCRRLLRTVMCMEKTPFFPVIILVTYIPLNKVFTKIKLLPKLGF